MIEPVIPHNQSPTNRPQISTNQILVENNSKKTNYYLPTYVRFKVKDIISLNIQELQGTVSGTLLFSFYYGQLSEQILKQFIENDKKSIILQFGRQQSLQLKEDKGIVLKCDEQKRMIDFVVRQEFVCNLKGDVFFTPFQIINLMLTITIQSVVLDPIFNNGERIDIKFNCMNSQQAVTINHSDNCNLGNYVLARRYIDSAYKNNQKDPFEEITFNYLNQTQNATKKPMKQKLMNPKQIIGGQQHQQIKPEDQMTNCTLIVQKKIKTKDKDKDKDKQAKIKNYQYAHFRIPLYKYPGASLVSIFIPLWVVGFINLLIFFQDNDLAGRIASIATLTLAFIAFIPTINEQIPQTPYIKLIEILIYLQTAASVLCLMESVSISNIPPEDYIFEWHYNAYYIVSIILNLINVVTVFSMFILHKCYWQKQYNIFRNQGKEQTLKRQKWKNSECDTYFKKFFKNGKIKSFKANDEIKQLEIE